MTFCLSKPSERSTIFQEQHSCLGKRKERSTPSGHRRYKIDKVFGGALTSKRRKIAYCRVSSQKQKKDLLSQKSFMQEKYPDHEIFSDIGSGINFKRKSFRKLVQLVLQGSVQELVVSHRDRLCRIAFSFFEWLRAYRRPSLHHSRLQLQTVRDSEIQNYGN